MHDNNQLAHRQKHKNRLQKQQRLRLLQYSGGRAVSLLYDLRHRKDKVQLYMIEMTGTVTLSNINAENALLNTKTAPLVKDRCLASNNSYYIDQRQTVYRFIV